VVFEKFKYLKYLSWDFFLFQPQRFQEPTQIAQIVSVNLPRWLILPLFALQNPGRISLLYKIKPQPFCDILLLPHPN
jgi:hypothetical protein